MVDQGREVYNRLKQKWLDNSDTLMHSTYNKGKSVVAERFIEHYRVKSINKWQHVIVGLIFII